MFDTIFGLPVHALVVHATVVMVPSAALAVAAAALWPWFRAWAGFLPLLLAVGAVVLVPITTASGGELEKRVPFTPLVARHVQLADGLLLPVLILGVAALAVTWVYVSEQVSAEPTGTVATLTGRFGAARLGTGRPGTAIVAVVMLVALAGSVSTLVQVARIGHSGARAAWSHTVTSSSKP